MDGIRIIRLPVERWEEYKRIRLEGLERDAKAFGATYAETAARPDDAWQERLRSVDGESQWLLFAEEVDCEGTCGALVGLMGAYRDEEAADCVNIYTVYVTERARGRGVGGRLMEALLREVAENESVRTAKLLVNVAQTAAVALYRRCGFEIVGHEEDEMGDGNVHPEYLMAKDMTRCGIDGGWDVKGGCRNDLPQTEPLP